MLHARGRTPRVAGGCSDAKAALLACAGGPSRSRPRCCAPAARPPPPRRCCSPAGTAAAMLDVIHPAALPPHPQNAKPRPAALGRRRGLLLPCLASSSGGPGPASASAVPERSVGVVLLAGGVGKRMGAPIPKQYLELKGQAIATYSLQTFGAMPEVAQIVIVCDPSWRYVFEARLPALPPHVAIAWALPGAERQDSVYNGLQQVAPDAAIVAVHDSARPLVAPADVRRCLADAAAVGAAVLGVPVKPTIKEVDGGNMVVKTLQRSKLWEVQTPQCIRPDLLRQGFQVVKDKGLEVTDDVSIIEAMGLPVKVTPGSYTNIKVTTPDDMSVAEKFLDEVKGAAAAAAAATTAGKPEQAASPSAAVAA